MKPMKYEERKNGIERKVIKCIIRQKEIYGRQLSCGYVHFFLLFHQFSSQTLEFG